MSQALTPILTMADIYGPGLIYAPRAHSSTSQWISQDHAQLDFICGNQQTILGGMPSITSEATACPEGMKLIAEADLKPAKPMRMFSTEQQAMEGLRDSCAEGWRIVIQHLLPISLLSEQPLWIPPALLSHLNNKGNLADFACPTEMPSRCRSSAHEIFRQAPKRSFPFVLKVATDLSSGAGGAVAVCRNESDLAAAAERFAACEHLIVESFISIRHNLCLNCAVMPDGSTRYLGHAAQHVCETGQYIGNWLNLSSELPLSVVEVATKITQKAAALGYRGIAGIDIALLQDGRLVVLDLNFRVNGSSAAVLLAPALLQKFGPAVAHLRGFTTNGFDKLIAISRSAVRNGHMIPLNTFNPALSSHPDSPPRLNALIVAESREEVLAIEADLASRGLS